MSGRILSLCCGHGMLENLLTRVKPGRDVISIDGQFINLLMTRHFVHGAGTYICHDVQFPLPFADASFSGVFASNCLPEIPTQRSFIREALRVTNDTGWTLMDSIWGLEFPGIQRIDRLREYRFCQNFFAQLADYVPFFEECAGPTRTIAVDIPGSPDKYRDGVSWIFDRPAIDSAIEAHTDWEVSVLAVTREKFSGFTVAEIRAWLSPETLAVSPVFEVASISHGRIELVRRPWFGRFPNMMAPKTFPALPEVAGLDLHRLDDPEYLLDRFCEAILVPLPYNFDRGPSNVKELVGG
jgi:SAM-dependent methyltransferase